MRKAALAGLFVLTILITGSSKVSAEALEFLQVNKAGVEVSQPVLLATLEEVQPVQPAPPPQPETPPQAKKYTVAENDSLSTIAGQHATTWKRLFDKNEVIKHPDVINVGDELVIPNPDEVLPDRPLPVPPPESAPEPQPKAVASAPKTQTSRPAAKPAAPRPAPQPQGSSAGNLYSAGYCTWYAKNRRPDLPNNLGNADTWVSRARAQGIPTGSTPRVGAIGQQGMHVVYVERVNGDGTVTISEMNFRGRYVVSSRTVAASNFMYIY